MSKQWVQIYTAYGQLDAAMMIDFLQANGIEATSMQESVGRTYGLTIGTLGEAIIYVPEDQKIAAEELINQMEQGKMELPDNQSSESEDSNDQTERNSD
jgi:hypothetical protein